MITVLTIKCNRKKSIVLFQYGLRRVSIAYGPLPVRDSNYCFTYFDLNQYGSSNYCRVLCEMFAINEFKCFQLSRHIDHLISTHCYIYLEIRYFRNFFIFFHWVRNILFTAISFFLLLSDSQEILIFWIQRILLFTFIGSFYLRR